MKKLSELEFRRDFVSAFKGDDTGNLRARQTPGVLYSKAVPTPVSKPELLAWSDELAQELEAERPTAQKDIDVLAGNLVTPSMYPYAACYAGHQFGNWAGQLGDGRAITLGELQTSSGKTWELQLKGAGPTAYSRRADGRAVLRSSLREYIMSEAMFYLGIPTTRALSLVSTGDQVMRDMFYDGHPEYEPGAIVMRVSPSFLRFGNFEMPAARRETDHLKQLVDWTIDRYYPHIQGGNRVIDWFSEVVERTASLMVEWLRVGFVHGVMNTDNMSILGLTIDYGPFSFLDDYDPNFTPNTTDLPGRRYAFGRQASIAYWNLGCLAGALAVLFDDKKDKELVAALNTYEDIFARKYRAMMGAKLGLDEAGAKDAQLIGRFEKLLATLKPDMTIFFQLLMELPESVENEDEVVNHFTESFYQEPNAGGRQTLHKLVKAYRERLDENTCSREESLRRMRESNPRFIPRNYLLHQAIEDLQKGDAQLFTRLQAAIKDPYSRNFDEFFARRPDWAAQKAGCSMLSCSS
jgi:uncharacterized protein YdiU (UPF0061 family)